MCGVTIIANIAPTLRKCAPHTCGLCWCLQHFIDFEDGKPRWCRYLLRPDLHVFASGARIGIYTVFFVFSV